MGTPSGDDSVEQADDAAGSLPDAPVDLGDFTPSAPVDVFAALREDDMPESAATAASTPGKRALRVPADEEEVEEPEPAPEPETERPPFETLDELLAAVTLSPLPEDEVQNSAPETEEVVVSRRSQSDLLNHRDTGLDSARAIQKPARPTAASTRPTGESVDVGRRSGHTGVLLVLALAALAATAAFAWLAWQERTTTSLALLAGAAVTTVVLWRAHAASAPADVTLTGGDLDIRTHDSHHRFDLSGEHTHYDEVGEPGRRGWKVLIHRKGMPPYVVDHRLVDPQRFSEALTGYRATD